MADDSDDHSTLTIYRRPGNSPAVPNVKSTLMPPGFDPLASPTDASARVAGIKSTLMPPGFDPLAPSGTSGPAPPKSTLMPPGFDPFSKTGPVPAPTPGPQAGGVEAPTTPPAAPKWSGAVLPISEDSAGKRHLDFNAGITGAIKNFLTLPGDVYAGRKNLNDPATMDEAIGMGVNIALGGAGRMPAGAARLGQRFAAEPGAPPGSTGAPPVSTKVSPPAAEAVAAEPTTSFEKLQSLRAENAAKAAAAPDPTLRQGLTEASNVFKGIFDPKALEGGETAASGLRQAMGRSTELSEQGKFALQKFNDQVESLPDADKLGLMHYLQTRSKAEAAGAQISDDWKPFLDTFRDHMQAVRSEIEGMDKFENAQFQDDYLTQLYKDPEAAKKFFGQARVGDKGFLKGKKNATYEDAINAGIEPLTLNPIELGVRYLDNAHRFVEVTKFMEESKAAGDWGLYPPGHQPEGWVEMKKYPRNPMTNQAAYAPEGFATIYNRFRSQGWEQFGRGGQALDALRATSNTLAGFKFALSQYHGLKTMVESVANGVSDALTTAQGGDLLGGAAKAVKSFGNPVSDFRRGRKLQNEYRDANSETLKNMPETRRAMDKLVDANFRFVGKGRASDEYRYSKAGSYKAFTEAGRKAEKAMLATDVKDWKGNPIGKTVPLIAKNVGRALETMSAPTFSVYIPAMKTSAAMRMMETFLKQNPTATDAEAAAYARLVTDRIDNRYGEMNQDNLFLPKLAQQLAQLATISWSYEFGTARSVAGAIKDTATLPMRVARGQKAWTEQMNYPIAYAIVGGTLSAMYQYFHTGKAPESVEDLIAPQSGGEDATTGKPERAILPGDEFSVMNFFAQPGESLKDKQAFWLQLGEHLAENADFRGDPISLSTDSNLQAVKTYGDYAAKEALPIFMSQPRKGKSNIGEIQRFLGVRPAGMRWTDPEGFKSMTSAVGLNKDADKAWHDYNAKRAAAGLPPSRDKFGWESAYKARAHKAQHKVRAE